jgi:hypothetical protein
MQQDGVITKVYCIWQFSRLGRLTLHAAARLESGKRLLRLFISREIAMWQLVLHMFKKKDISIWLKELKFVLWKHCPSYLLWFKIHDVQDRDSL